ncbi:MAG: DUF4230 domain-containing protein [Muribaculaceae bacterium]|nr:DUF4230 domain-containing protein [Muribaculaceae bacterium]MDE6026975.1 DUF4230 domain-containing protein [Muribaculaceae bacterium]
MKEMNKARNIAKILKWLTLLLVLVGAVWAVVWFRRSGEEVPPARIEKAKVIDVRPMLKLCSVEIYEDVPIKANIGKRHLFARARLTGNILFDLERARSEWSGDTLVVILPPEIVQIRESTDPGSYEVIDTWNDRFLGSSNFTASEENEIKRKAVDQWRRQLYKRGYVRRARAEAISNLGNMLAPFAVGKEVRIVDPAPEGYPDGVKDPGSSGVASGGQKGDSASSIAY